LLTVPFLILQERTEPRKTANWEGKTREWPELALLPIKIFEKEDIRSEELREE